MLQGLSEPEFYGDLVCKFRKNVGKPEFSDHFSKIVIKQSACLAVKPIRVDHFAYLFDCTPVGRASDCDGPDLKKLFI